MQCILKSNILNLKSQGREQDPKNKFRTEESIGSLIETKFVEHRTWLITTTLSNAYKDHYGKRCLIQAVHRWGLQNYQTTFGIQGRLAAMTRFLVQPTMIVDQKWSWYTRVPYNTTLLRLRILSLTDQLPRVRSCILRIWWLGSRLNSRFTLDIFNIFFLRW
jgi:hypothetical protein